MSHQQTFVIMAKISWDTESVALPSLDYEKIQDWIVKVAATHEKIVGRLGYLLCDDEAMLAANRQYLGHDYYTDIITFDYSHGERISGDMIISLDTVRSNAEVVGETYRRELLRVIIHGVLHLCGINDKGPGEREIMEAHEDAALALIDVDECFT